jgi:hypothetical protein
MQEARETGSSMFAEAIRSHLSLRESNAHLNESMPLDEYMPRQRGAAVDAGTTTAQPAPAELVEVGVGAGAPADEDTGRVARGEAPASLPELSEPGPFTVPQRPRFIDEVIEKRRRLSAIEIEDELPDFLRDLPEIETAWLEREGRPEFDWGD